MGSGYWRIAVATVLLTVACNGVSATKAPPVTPAPRATTAAPTPRPVVHGNELGQVPVLMYHQLLAQPRGDYDQTPAQYRAELASLYRSGYRTITAASLVRGSVDVPAGKSPMVLTFDDSTASQFAEMPDGSVDPASAIGILLAVGKGYEDKPVATLYVNAHPFAGRDTYLKKLAALGMEIGGHTASHANLRRLDDAGVQRELAGGLALITRQGLTATTVALPFGAHPHNPVLAHRGHGYSFAGVFLVGSNPARSPYDKGFDPFNVPRIRSGSKTGDQMFTSSYWLPRLVTTRYVSDGDPATVSFPRGLTPRLDPRFRARARPY